MDIKLPAAEMRRHPSINRKAFTLVPADLKLVKAASSPSSPKAATTHARQVEGEEDEGRGGSLQPQMLRQPRGGCTQAAADSSCFCCSW